MVYRILIITAWLGYLVLLLGFAGAAHRSLDSLSLLRPLAIAVTILGVFLHLRSRPLHAVWLLILAQVGCVTVGKTLWPQAPGDDIRIYAKNMWFGNNQVEALAADIVASGADAVFLQELSDKNARILALLSADYPHQHVCDFSSWIKIAVLSRSPVLEAECTNHRALAAARIDHKGTDLWLVSAHIPWPWPQDSRANEADAVALLETLEGPVVIAGDFNIFAWSHRVGKIASVTQTQLAGPSLPTLTFKHIPLPIDHALAPNGGSVARRPLLGADHQGIVADLNL